MGSVVRGGGGPGGGGGPVGEYGWWEVQEWVGRGIGMVGVWGVG